MAPALQSRKHRHGVIRVHGLPIEPQLVVDDRIGPDHDGARVCPRDGERLRGGEFHRVAFGIAAEGLRNI